MSSPLTSNRNLRRELRGWNAMGCFKNHQQGFCIHSLELDRELKAKAEESMNNERKASERERMTQPMIDQCLAVDVVRCKETPEAGEVICAKHKKRKEAGDESYSIAIVPLTEFNYLFDDDFATQPAERAQATDARSEVQ